MEQGISQIEVGEVFGVNEVIIVNWEIRGMVPAKRHLEKLRTAIPALLADHGSR